jgi:hypothetical protein
MTRACFAPIGAALLLVIGAAPLGAQDSATAGALEFAVGPVWMGRATLAGADANETTSSGTPFRLFTTSSTISSMAGLEGRVAYRLMPRLELQGSAGYVAPDLRVAISGDVENAPPTTAAEQIRQFTFAGGVSWYVSTGGALAWFIEAEGGYLRLLHEDRTLAATGRTYSAGFGVKYAFHTSSSGVKAVGARIDARAVARSRATLFDETRISPAAAVDLYIRF